MILQGLLRAVFDIYGFLGRNTDYIRRFGGQLAFLLLRCSDGIDTREKFRVDCEALAKSILRVFFCSYIDVSTDFVRGDIDASREGSTDNRMSSRCVR